MRGFVALNREVTLGNLADLRLCTGYATLDFIGADSLLNEFVSMCNEIK